MKRTPHQTLHAAQKRLLLYKRFALFWGASLVLLFVVYGFVIGPAVFRGEAAQTLLCLRICAQGVSPCLPTTCANPAAATTQAVTAIAQTSATGNGTVTSDGGDTVTDRGMALATTTEPTTDDTVYVASTAGTGSYSVSLISLTAATKYYVRAYATNGVGTSYGSTVNFTTLSVSGSTTPPPSGGSSAPSSGNLGKEPKNETKPEPKKPIADLLVPSKNVDNKPHVAFGVIEDIAGKKHVKTNDTGRQTFSIKHPVFKGTTNIKNAHILIALYSAVVYATVDADAQGNWIWVASPSLADGEHTIVILAVSPDDQSVAVSANYTFIVATETPAPVTQPPATTPPSSNTNTQTSTPSQIPTTGEPSPATGGTSGGVPEVTFTPETPVPGYTHDYVVNVQVLSKPEDINKQGSVDIKTEVVSFNPDVTEPVQMTYTLYNSEGTQLFKEQKSITVTDKTVDYSRAVTSQPLEPGNYVVDVQMQFKGKSVGTSKVFEVKSYKVIDVPLIAVTERQLILGIQRSTTVVGLLLFVFLLLLYRERRFVRRATRQVNDTDLFQSGMIA